MIQTLGTMALAAGHDIFAAPERRSSESLENPNVPLARGWDLLPSGPPTSAGISVSPDAAMAISAVYRCISIISEGIAQMPLITYRRDASGDGRDRAKDHYAYDLLSKKVNPRMTAYRWKRQQVAWVLGWGNAYSIMQEPGNGRVTALWPIHPRYVQWRPELGRDGIYLVQTSDGMKPILPHSMLHFRGLETDDTGVGLSILSKARESLGMTLAQENYGSSFFRSGAAMSGFFQVPEQMSEAAKKSMFEYLDKTYAGAGNARKMGILDGGVTFKELSIKPADAEFLATRKFQRNEICTWFGVPPHKIGDMDGAKYGNLTEQEISFARHTLGPYVANIEQEINTTLFSTSEGKVVFSEFLMDALLRADPATRAEIFNTMRQNGALNANEWRRAENMNPIPGEAGEMYLVNGNMLATAAAKAATKTNKEQVV